MFYFPTTWKTITSSLVTHELTSQPHIGETRNSKYFTEPINNLILENICKDFIRPNSLWNLWYCLGTVFLHLPWIIIHYKFSWLIFWCWERHLDQKCKPEYLVLNLNFSFNHLKEAFSLSEILLHKHDKILVTDNDNRALHVINRL